MPDPQYGWGGKEGPTDRPTDRQTKPFLGRPPGSGKYSTYDCISIRMEWSFAQIRKWKESTPFAVKYIDRICSHRQNISSVLRCCGVEENIGNTSEK